MIKPIASGNAPRFPLHCAKHLAAATEHGSEAALVCAIVHIVGAPVPASLSPEGDRISEFIVIRAVRILNFATDAACPPSAARPATTYVTVWLAGIVVCPVLAPPHATGASSSVAHAISSPATITLSHVRVPSRN